MTGSRKPAWSARTNWDTAETPWAQHLARLRQQGAPLFDLTASNPTHCGFIYDPADVLAPLNDAAALAYDPDPKGSRTARQAVSLYYRDRGAVVDAEQILMTASTSEAYSFLFRLLCDPGDEVLIARPGYPLFDFLARLDDVCLVPYELFYDHGWHLDLEALRRRIAFRSRAIVVVHPNNPTGHFTRPADREALQDLCRKHDLSLIVDEVFLDYPLPGWAGESFAAGAHPVPTFVLSGLSKVAALPQMKAAWIACFAPAEAMNRLEVIGDTFLSVSAPVQCALPAWLSWQAVPQRAIRQRIEANLATLDAVLGRQTLMTRLIVESGWYAVLRVPALQPQEETALQLLLEWKVVVHPGAFFEFPGQGWLVLSLLPPEPAFALGVEAIHNYFAGSGRNQVSY